MKRFNTFVLIALIILSCRYTWAGTYGGGHGTVVEPYLISDPDHLLELSNNSSDWSEHFIMTENMDFAPIKDLFVNPIGNQAIPFTGLFDGNGYSILNFEYNSTMQYAGLFGTVESDGQVIDNLTLVGPYVRFSGNSRYAGALVGHLKQGSVSNCNIINTDMITVQFSGILIGLNEGDISDCDVSGSITVYGYSGGLVGENIGSITDCTASVIVTTTSDTYFVVGGLVGINGTGGEISNCSSSGQVTGVEMVGGLVGKNNAVITNCIFDGTVIGKDSHIGGLIGYSNGIVAGCQANCDVTCTDNNVDFIGGLIGSNAGSVTNCSTYGTVSVSDWNSEDVGGFIGYNHDSTVMDCQSNSDVIGAGPDIGGFIGTNTDSQVIRCAARGNVVSNYTTGSVGGFIGQSTAPDSIKCCYASGDVSGGEKVGGLIGEISGNISLTDCFATGSLSGSKMVGGLVGYNNNTLARNCYSTCSVPKTGISIGGLVGQGPNYSNDSSYWDIESSGTTASADGIGKATFELKQQTTFTNWDFTEAWGIEDDQTYPFLRLTYPAGDIDFDKDVDLVDLTKLAQNWLLGTD